MNEKRETTSAANACAISNERYNVHRLRSLILGMLVGHVVYICTDTFRDKYTRMTCPIPPLISDGETRKHSPRILCYINTFPPQYETKAVHVYHTWARQCTKTWFTSTQAHPYLPIMRLNLTKPETRMHLWSKMRQVLRQLYTERDRFDFFYKADDDTYAVVENLLDAVSVNSPDDPIMTGFRWKTLCPGGYFSGGSGYILSRQALKQLVERAIDKHPDCPVHDEDKEDVKMCLCGQAAGVKLVDSIGPTGRSLFYPYWLDKFFANGIPFPTLNGNHLSFHYVQPKWMYLIHFFVYVLNPGTIPIADEVSNLKRNATHRVYT